MRTIAIAIAFACSALPSLAQEVDPHANSAYFFEAPRSQADGARAFYGNIAWTDSVNEGRHELVGKGLIEGRVVISVTIGRNTDPASPASLVFNIAVPPASSAAAGASNDFVELRDLTVTSNPLDDLGTHLTGVGAPAATGSFLFVGSGEKADAEKNASLLQGARWLQFDLKEAGGLSGELLLRFTPDAQAAMKQVLGAKPTKP